MVFQLIPFLTQLLIGTLLQVVGFLVMGGAKKGKPAEVQDLEAPTAEAGIPIPVVFGEVEIVGVNAICTADIQTILKEVSA
jgi:hypothetical protein